MNEPGITTHEKALKFDLDDCAYLSVRREHSAARAGTGDVAEP